MLLWRFVGYSNIILSNGAVSGNYLLMLLC
jgi:hypothetical protein